MELVTWWEFWLKRRHQLWHRSACNHHQLLLEPVHRRPLEMLTTKKQVTVQNRTDVTSKYIPFYFESSTSNKTRREKQWNCNFSGKRHHIASNNQQTVCIIFHGSSTKKLYQWKIFFHSFWLCMILIHNQMGQSTTTMAKAGTRETVMHNIGALLLACKLRYVMWPDLWREDYLSPI